MEDLSHFILVTNVEIILYCYYDNLVMIFNCISKLIIIIFNLISHKTNTIKPKCSNSHKS